MGSLELETPPDSFNPETRTEIFRQTLLQGREALRQRYYSSGNGAALLRDHSRLLDDILRRAWRAMAMPDSIALLAVGGYGRQQLFPFSDIDLLVLLPAEGQGYADAADGAVKVLLEQWVRLLWDIGLEIGHSVRTIPHCTEEAMKDITVQTSLLEARQLTGHRQLFDEFVNTMKARLKPGLFFQAKQREQEQRHGRYHDATHNLEPNIKESPGGLRDLQNVLWVSRAAGFGKSWSELARRGLITPREARLAQRHQAILQDLRIRLHYLAGRREDRLLFDFQTTLADELSMSAKPPRRASEMLMQRYYRAAKGVTQVNTILLLTLEARIFPGANAVPVVINERFQKLGEWLEATDENVFRKEPGAILESALLLQQRPDLKARSAATLRAMWQAVPLIDAVFRRDPRHSALFMEILRQPRGLTSELRLLNRYGILGRYLPAFGRIVGQMQHDLFHVYTVDEHILMVVRNLRRFLSPEFAHEYPLCSRLIGEFERPEVLYIAGLFHDIAKGRQGDHSKLGKKDADRFCRNHAISRDDTELITWLVENHLVMSMTAQKKDISDPDVIADFARQVSNERRLVALYLLTVADIRGTSPKVWNAWKSKLLEDLFRATRRQLCGEPAYADRTLTSRKNKVMELLQSNNIAVSGNEQLWRILDPAYLLSQDPQQIAWHAGHLIHQTKPSTPVVKTRIAPAGTGIEVLVYAADQKDLFARICSFFDRVDCNIVEARIHTTRHGYALDSFLVLDPFDMAHQRRDVVDFIEHELAQQLAQHAPLQPPLKGRLSRHLRHFPIKPKVDIELDEKGEYHILSIVAGDQPGLLSRIAQVLVSFGVNVQHARINTLGERAEDTFLVTGDALKKSRTLLHLETELVEALQTSSEAVSDPG
ncbi:UTP--GlnB (protein PII) uridylyltransferase, GlnD [Nitrosospira sp. Nsp14]|uniref:[protein-PII] uridylyltransferase n=1 Tax=Nitrosospira sp. Nsp14 TaxID=1855333 RepID=UPI0008EDF2DB|nr:[protein-PII] uridylyltransferase [Nitrosospira sp. Nsp14]SFH13288.1 UTP--GlnB (protein PII) uridylyltransferase, GlnD [Nitrosospira sp. Nsp14]